MQKLFKDFIREFHDVNNIFHYRSVRIRCYIPQSYHGNNDVVYLTQGVQPKGIPTFPTFWPNFYFFFLLFAFIPTFTKFSKEDHNFVK